MTSKTGQQIITIHILPDISRSKIKQTMKLGQSIEHNVRKVFLEKPYTNFCGEGHLRPFYKNQN